MTIARFGANGICVNAAESVPSMSNAQTPTVVEPKTLDDFVVLAAGVGPLKSVGIAIYYLEEKPPGPKPRRGVVLLRQDVVNFNQRVNGGADDGNDRRSNV